MNKDHPRSRGVYSAISGYTLFRSGSSPLARGLQFQDAIVAFGMGIIPARAGFTSNRNLTDSLREDHPRSRGVYHPVTAETRTITRIIPARAGFTRSPRPPRRSMPDHPRSRGVYSGDSTRPAVLTGSSPLARGLRGGRGSSRPWPTDHPRSRGVYARSYRIWVTLRGSSPLARGLLAPVVQLRRFARIIPARAGFTRFRVQQEKAFADHPRSRGVYAGGAVQAAMRIGSSPLARGLQDQ